MQVRTLPRTWMTAFHWQQKFWSLASRKSSSFSGLSSPGVLPQLEHKVAASHQRRNNTQHYLSLKVKCTSNIKHIIIAIITDMIIWTNLYFKINDLLLKAWNLYSSGPIHAGLLPDGVQHRLCLHLRLHLPFASPLPQPEKQLERERLGLRPPPNWKNWPADKRAVASVHV